MSWKCSKKKIAILIGVAFIMVGVLWGMQEGYERRYNVVIFSLMDYLHSNHGLALFEPSSLRPYKDYWSADVQIPSKGIYKITYFPFGIWFIEPYPCTVDSYDFHIYPITNSIIFVRVDSCWFEWRGHFFYENMTISEQSWAIHGGV